MKTRLIGFQKLWQSSKLCQSCRLPTRQQTGKKTLVFLYCIVIVAAKAQTVSSVSSKKQVFIGEPFQVLWTVAGAGKAEIILPKPGWKNAEILSWKDINITDSQGVALFRRTFRLMFLEPGNHVLSEQIIRVRRNNSVHQLPIPALSIRCVLLPVAQPETNIEPPLRIGYSHTEWLPYAAGTGGLLLMAVGWVAYRRRNRVPTTRTKHFANRPYALAVKELKALRENSIFQKDQTSYGRLSRIIKDFLAGKFQMAAHQLTDREIGEVLSEKGVDERKIIEMKNIVSEIKSRQFSEDDFSIENFQSVHRKTANLLKEMNI